MRLFLPLLALLLLSSVVSASETRGIQLKLRDQAGSIGLKDYDPSKFHALVIGISDYLEWPDLVTPVNDAEKIASVLKEAYGFGDVQLMRNEEATRSNILKVLHHYRSTLGESESLLIYFAGHGHKVEALDIGYWVPHDGKRDTEQTGSYIANSELTSDYFRTFKVQHLLVMADSCFSGLLRGAPSSLPAENFKTRFQKPSRWILSSGAIEPVPDNAGNGHSPFATRVLQYLTVAGPSVFSSQDLYAYIYNNLSATSPLFSPVQSASHVPGGEFVFMREEKDSGVLPSAVLEKIATVALASPPSLPLQPPPRPPMETPPPQVLSFLITQPEGATLEVNGRRHEISSELFIELPAGRHPFSLYVPARSRTIYGVLEVIDVDENTQMATFGAGGEDVLFKDSHIRAALAGSPVRYDLGLQNKVVARYQLSLRKLH